MLILFSFESQIFGAVALNIICSWFDIFLFAKANKSPVYSYQSKQSFVRIVLLAIGIFGTVFHFPGIKSIRFHKRK